MRAWMLALAGCAIILDFAAPRLTAHAGGDVGREPVTLQGYLCAPAEPAPHGGVSFLFCPDDTDWRDAGMLHSGAIRVTTLDGHTRGDFAGAMRLRLKLEAPVAPLNEGGGGYERWLYQQRIQATAELVDREKPAGGCTLACQYHNWRVGLIDRLDQHLSRMRHPELAEALLLGSRARLDDEHWEVFEATGTQHLVAISGLHLGLVAVLVSQLLFHPGRRLSPRHPRLARWVPLALTLFGALVYALLAGFTVPTQRALIMVAVAGVALRSGRQWRLWDGWLLAAVFVILLEPRAVLGLGFWFSFGAVACLILAFGARYSGVGPIRSLLIAQVAVVAGLMPLMVAFGLQPSWLAFPANLVAIPLLSLVLMPLLLLAAPLVLLAPWSASWVEPGLDLVFRILWLTLEFLAGFEGALPAFGVGTMLLASAGILVAIGPVGWRYRLAIAMATLTLFLMPPAGTGSSAPETELRFPDGFGGPVALIRHEGRAVLFDARSPDAGYRQRTRDRVLPWLEALGVAHLDAVILSHPGVRPEEQWNLTQGPVINRLLTAEACADVKAIDLPGIALRPWRDPRGKALSQAEQACNLRLQHQGFRAVLFGPIRRSGERRLLMALKDPGSIDLVLAPRGGASDSSQLGLIEALDPRWAILTPRHWSPWRHPPAKARYKKAGGDVLVTSATGEVRVSLAEEGAPRPESARETSLLHPEL